MNNNHFFYSYSGNKRNEYKYLKDFFNFDDIKDIYECFCGSSAISFLIWKEYKNNFNYHLSDNDANLINIYNYYKNNDINDIYLKLNEIKNIYNNKKDYDNLRKEINFNTIDFILTDDNIIYYIFFNKCYSIRPALFNPKQSIRDLKPNKELNDWKDNFKDDKKNLYIFDPPYILSENSFYNNLDKNNNIYEYFYNNYIGNFKCKILFILENNWVINLLFKDFIKYIYEKKYEISKRKTTHCIINNYS